ncbi:MAG: trypsin-like peptidase domain-containing protein [Sedimentisphaerales bacterium]|nr:trypsin-like peptidase domain-containing protein [Sedimentisphaerales bacterium]
MLKRLLVFIIVFVCLNATWGQLSPAVGDTLVGQPDFRDVVAQSKDKVFPTVVYIKCLRESHESGKKSTEEVSGSGVIISPIGEVLTNWHVVDKAIEVRCLLHDGEAMGADVVGSDKDTDLALLKLKNVADMELPFAELGDSAKLKEGDFVMAMGAPWGLSRSVSIGIISCTRRYLPDNSEYSLWLQTDASISPGNSGGPLINTEGRVIGVNTRGVSSGGDMGFAVPSETIEHIVRQLREFGKVNWSWLGLQLQPLRDFERNIYFEGDQGVIVAETDPESPARHAGVMARDRIMTIAGEPVTALTAEDLPAVRRKLGLLPKNVPVTLQLRRNNDDVVIELTPTEKGKVEGEEFDCSRWDLTVKAINRFDNPDLYFHRQKGVFIYGVEYPGNANSAGLQEKDIILKIDGEAVAILDDVKAIYPRTVENLAAKPRLVFEVLRNGLLRVVVLDIARDYEKE